MIWAKRPMSENDKTFLQASLHRVFAFLSRMAELLSGYHKIKKKMLTKENSFSIITYASEATQNRISCKTNFRRNTQEAEEAPLLRV